MKHTCDICGRELGFFERPLKIENSKLGVGYESLCSDCRKNVRKGIEEINNISAAILEKLNTKYAVYPYAQSNINILMFLAVKEIYKQVPDFSNPENILLKTFYPEQNTINTAFDDLKEITYKVLRNSFISVLGRYGLDTFEAFSGYMGRECLFFDSILANTEQKEEFCYNSLFVCPSGLVFLNPENGQVRSLFVSEDRTLKFTESEDEVTYNIDISKQRYNNFKAKPIIKFNRKDLRRELAHKINEYNNAKAERIESELSALVNNFNVLIERDLRDLHPNLDFENIPLDSVLTCIVKNLFEQDINKDYVKEAPDGLLSLIVEKNYPVNLERSGMVDVSEIQDYLNDACNFIMNIRSSFDGKNNVPSFAFLTPSAYLFSQLGDNKVCLNARDGIPNDLYCGYQHMIFEGKDEFFIPISTTQKNEEGYYFLDGIRVHSKLKEPMQELEEFFSRYALNYYEDQYEKELEKLDSLREKEIADIAKRIFYGYGYLPFTIYDEWASIERSLRNSDVLMRKIIPERERKTGSKNNRVFYASRTVNAFEQQAGQLSENLEVEDLPVARALLWRSLKEEIKKACSEEFIRLAGDFLQEDDTLESSILKYSVLESIEPEKTYFLGLFIYYLMDKGLLEDTDFLDHYDTVAKIFIKNNPEIKQLIEFTELTIPDRKPFDTDNNELQTFNDKIKTEKKDVSDSGDVLLSIRQEAEDKDSFDQTLKDLELEPPDDKLVSLSDLVLEMNDTEVEVAEVKADDFSTTAVIDVITDEMIEAEREKEENPSLINSIIDKIKRD